MLVRLEAGGDAAALAPLAAALAQLGARMVVFPTDPRLGPEAAGSVVAGRHARPERPGSGSWVFTDPPVNGAAAWGAVVLPPLEGGVVRRLPASIRVDGEPVPTLPVAAARAAGLPTPETEYLPRFPASAEVLPAIDARRVLEGRVPAELVSGRVAVIAPATDPRLPGFATSAVPGAAALSLPELHAVALDSLLSGKAARGMGEVAAVLVVLAALPAGLLLYLRIGPRHWHWAALGVTAGILAAGWLALRFAGILLPVAALLVSQAVLSVALWRQREVAEDRALRGLRRGLSARLRAIAAPAFEGEGVGRADAWAAAAAMTSRLLGLRRSLFLVPRSAGAEAPTLEQAVGIGASLADIPPDLRDPTALPFGRAFREGGPVAVERRFLASAGPDEEVWLAPLSVGGADGTGFWAFTLPAGEPQRLPALMEAVRAAMEGLEMPSDRAATAGAQSLDAELARDVERMMARAATLAGVLNQVSTATVVFDPLGRVLHLNARMEAAAGAAALADSAALAPTDLVAALGGLDQAAAARLVRRVTLDRVPVELNATRQVGGRRHLLRLAVPETAGGGAAPALLIELVDVTEPLRLAEIQRGFAEHVGLKLRNVVEAIGLGAGLLVDSRLPEVARGRVLTRLQSALEAMRTTVAMAESFMAFEVGERRLQAYPVDALAALRGAFVEAEAAASRRRGLRLELNAPEIASLALAEPAALDAALRAMLLVLVDDAREGGRVTVAVEETAESIRIAAASEGYGMSGARLADVLAGD